ncbi:MAG: DUF4251 domain-containing protein [Bacteroidales bacterium]
MRSFSFLCFSVILVLLQAFPLSAKDKKEMVDSLYTRLSEDSFRIEVNRASTASVPNTMRFNPTGFIEKNDSLVKGQLPFYGKAYSAPYGGQDGIFFDDKVREIELKKKKGRVEMRLEVAGKSDQYRFLISFFVGGNVQIQMNSNQREASTYSGTYVFFYYCPLKHKELGPTR